MIFAEAFPSTFTMYIPLGSERASIAETVPSRAAVAMRRPEMSNNSSDSFPPATMISLPLNFTLDEESADMPSTADFWSTANTTREPGLERNRSPLRSAAVVLGWAMTLTVYVSEASSYSASNEAQSHTVTLLSVSLQLVACLDSEFLRAAFLRHNKRVVAFQFHPGV